MSYTTPRVTPYLLYEDLDGTVDWLANAFGLRERLRHAGPDGRSMHAEMTVGDDGVILMGRLGPPYRNPKRLGQHTLNLYVRVEDIDGHFARAVKAGAVVLEEPTNQPYGDRRYGVEDPEGHHWYFCQSIAGSSAA